MKKRMRFTLLCLLVICLTVLAGCRKSEDSSLNVPDPTNPVDNLPAGTEVLPEQKTAVTFDYAPGSMGIYVMADPDIEAGPEVLDSITMTLSDKHKELTRRCVSNRQFDFIKSGHQAGGFLLVDIPRNMLQKKPESWKEFLAIADYLANQVMPDIYPSKSYISGGGHVDFCYDLPVYMVFMVQTENRDQYVHCIYIGEKYIYDFWHDTAWLADSGETIMSTLYAEDIKPELNRSERWSIHDFTDFPGVPLR